jgi:hypothetical protein
MQSTTLAQKTIILLSTHNHSLFHVSAGSDNNSIALPFIQMDLQSSVRPFHSSKTIWSSFCPCLIYRRQSAASRKLGKVKEINEERNEKKKVDSFFHS